LVYVSNTIQFLKERLYRHKILESIIYFLSAGLYFLLLPLKIKIKITNICFVFFFLLIDAFFFDLLIEIAAIQTLQYTDKPQRCIDTLHHFFNLISSSDDAKRWNIRIQLTLCNVFVREKEWRMALVSLEYVLRHLIDAVPIEVLHCVSQLQMDNNSRVNDDNDNIAQLLLVASRIEVLSRQGRILVQAGAMSEAEQMFHRIEEEDYVVFCTVKQRMLQQGQSELYQRIVNSQWFVQKVSTNVIINKGIILFAREQYAQAMDQYTLAIEEERYFNSKDASGYCHNMLHPGIGLDPPEEHSSYLPHCLNNLGLCALYSCRMHEAVVMLESLVRENPTLYLTETLTFNLCTLYELGSDNATSGRKKRILQLIAKRFSLHDIGTESFRIS
jgi:tetratricopeptide (TPR) repeat protein